MAHFNGGPLWSLVAPYLLSRKFPGGALWSFGWSPVERRGAQWSTVESCGARRGAQWTYVSLANNSVCGESYDIWRINVTTAGRYDTRVGSCPLAPRLKRQHAVECGAEVLYASIAQH